jgi:hypothetical protein
VNKKCKGCGHWFDGLPSEDYCDECVSDEENLMPWDYICEEETEEKKDDNKHYNLVSFGDHLWVSLGDVQGLEKRFSDAQEEIKRLKGLLLKYNNEIIKHERKLEELWNQRPLPKDFDTGIPDELDPTCTKLNTHDYIEANEKWRKKFEELLKEEKAKGQ